jgi:hypothetical protein
MKKLEALMDYLETPTVIRFHLVRGCGLYELCQQLHLKYEEELNLEEDVFVFNWWKS